MNVSIFLKKKRKEVNNLFKKKKLCIWLHAKRRNAKWEYLLCNVYLTVKWDNARIERQMYETTVVYEGWIK